jgi:hypothetical protein
MHCIFAEEFGPHAHPIPPLPVFPYVKKIRHGCYDGRTCDASPFRYGIISWMIKVKMECMEMICESRSWMELAQAHVMLGFGVNG